MQRRARLSKYLVEFAPAGAKKCRSVPRGGVYLTRNTLRPASVEFVCLRHTNYARSRVQPHSNANPMQWFAFEACQKDFFDTRSARRQSPPGAFACSEGKGVPLRRTDLKKICTFRGKGNCIFRESMVWYKKYNLQ